MNVNPIRRKISPESPIWSIHIGYAVVAVLAGAYYIYTYQELPSVENVLNMTRGIPGVNNNNNNNNGGSASTGSRAARN